MKTVDIKINGYDYTMRQGITILDASFETLKFQREYLQQIAPAVRAALGEAFEFPIGVDVEGRIAEALHRAGFDKVFDTKFGADLTIMEEANELVERIRNDGVLPMITSCCPARPLSRQ